jgi:hypothetical protein
MTNPYFGFPGFCHRCGFRVTYSLVCEPCEIRIGRSRAEDSKPEIDNSSVVDARLASGPSPAARRRPPAPAARGVNR